LVQRFPSDDDNSHEDGLHSSQEIIHLK